MSDSFSKAPQRIELRAAIAAVADQVAQLTHTQLASAWQKLVPLIAPEAEPDSRDCPYCKRPIVRLATRCLHCWKKSAPPAAGH